MLSAVSFLAVTEILLAMLSICSEEELDSDSAESDDGDPPEGETDADRPSLPRMKRLTDTDSSTNKRDGTVKPLRTCFVFFDIYDTILCYWFDCVCYIAVDCPLPPREALAYLSLLVRSLQFTESYSYQST